MLGMADPVQNVTAKRMPIRHQWMVEVVGRVVDHPDLLHHASRANIAWRRGRHDFSQPQRIESKSQRRSGAFSGIAPTPVVRGKTPTDLDAGREVRLEVRNGESNEPNERHHAGNFNGPEAEAVPVECFLELTRQRIALFSRQRRQEVLHDARIGVQRGEWRPVRRKPGAQSQPIGQDFRSHSRSRLLVSAGLWRRADLYQQRRGGFRRHVDDDMIADV